ncbi:MAG: hypothetical protein AAGF44_00380 [Pseudomonadota bacterium]
MLLPHGAHGESGSQPRLADALYQSPEDGGARRWEVVADSATLHAAPGASVIEDLGRGAVLSNMGCSKKAADLWCHVRPFRGGQPGFVRADRLAPAEGPDGITPVGVDDSRRRAGRGDFDASGRVPCAQERGQALGQCKLGVSRGQGGDATLVATFPNGFARRLFFVHGVFISASATMSGVGRDVDWRLEDGTHLIRVDDQRFEIPNALIFGE